LYDPCPWAGSMLRLDVVIAYCY